MILLGDPSVLAVELLEGPPGFVGVRLCINGTGIGDPKLYGTAGALAASMEDFRHGAERRLNPILMSMPSRECLDTVYEEIFGRRPTRRAGDPTAGRMYAAALLSPNFCESLDAYLVVVASDGVSQRVVSRGFSSGTVDEVNVASGTVEKLFQQAEPELWRLDATRKR